MPQSESSIVAALRRPSIRPDPVMTTAYFGRAGMARAKNNGFARSKPASEPVIIVEPAVRGAGGSSSQCRTRPSASEPALPEAEPGRPVPGDVQAQEPWHQEHRRSVRTEHSSSGQPGHSRSEPEHSSSEPPAHRPSGSEPHRSEPVRSTTELGRHSRNRCCSRSHNHGDGGDNDGDGSHSHHRIHRRIHHIHRRNRRTRTG
jgi:hypothetical protein